MAGFIFDRVCETSTTTGTGNLTLAGAVAGFQSFNGAGAGTGTNEFYYLIEAVDGNGNPTGDWETGIGLCPTTTTLQRLIVLSSSNAGALVAFATGTKRVHLTAPAAQLAFNGVVATRSANLTAQNFTTAAAIAWNSTGLDTEPTGAGFHETVTNPSRITIPADGYDSCVVRLTGQVSLQNIAASDWVDLKIRQDGATAVGHAVFTTLNTSPFYQVQSQIILGGGSSYFEMMIQVGTDTSVDLMASGSWFQLEVLQ